MRMLASVAVVIGFVSSAFGHYFFIIPSDQDATGYRLVLSDSATPDLESRFEVGQSGKFFAESATGPISPVALSAAVEGGLLFPASSLSATELYGTVHYGVVLRGQTQPALILHHPRAIVAPLKVKQSGSAIKSHSDRVLELTPNIKQSGVVFVVTSNGKPLAGTDVVVYVPDEKRVRAVKTNEFGETPSFEKPGLYAARATMMETRSGEFQGKSFQQVRHYSTVSVRLKSNP